MGILGVGVGIHAVGAVDGHRQGCAAQMHLSGAFPEMVAAGSAPHAVELHLPVRRGDGQFPAGWCVVVRIFPCHVNGSEIEGHEEDVGTVDVILLLLS